MRIFGYRITANWGHLVFVTAIAITTLVYLFDALSVSHHIYNLILVTPVTGIILLLYAWVVKSEIHVRSVRHLVGSDENRATVTADKQEFAKSIALIALTGIYVFSFELVGMDVASFVFVSCVLYLLGERRIIFVLCYALIFTFIVVGGAAALLPYPMPMALL